jgi:hypothetical protein
LVDFERERYVKRSLPLLLLAQLATCFLLVRVLLLAMLLAPEQCWNPRSALLLMMYPKAIG